MDLGINIIILFLAPGSYDVEKVEKSVHQSSPAYTFEPKYKEEKHENLPGNYAFNYGKKLCWYLYDEKTI